MFHSGEGVAAVVGQQGGRRRGGKREKLELELNDRDQAKVALRRALDGNNIAAMVAAAEALIEFDRSPDCEEVTVEDARAQLDAKLNEIVLRRRERYPECTACNGRGYLMDPGQGRGARIDGGRGGAASTETKPRAVLSEQRFLCINGMQLK